MFATRGYSALFLLSIGSILVSSSRFPLRRYHYISTKMSWPEAQRYCREHYSDLATFESMEEVQQLQPNISYTWAWIGLIDDPGSWKGVLGKDPNSWRWSATGEPSRSGYHNWGYIQPDYWDRSEICVLMQGGGWHDKNCNLLNGFVCFTGSPLNPVSYHFINIASTWSQAQAYCRKYYTDLAIIENSTQNTDTEISIMPSNQGYAWIGLYRVPWTWSDNSRSSFRNWAAGKPNNPSTGHCALENPQHVWDDEYCYLPYPIICQTISKLRTYVRLILQTGADGTHPVNYDQIMQKVDAEIRLRGWTHFRLTWTTEPAKQIFTNMWTQWWCKFNF